MSSKKHKLTKLLIASDNVESTILHRRPYTVAFVRHMGKVGWGVSKVCWPDEWVPETGRDIAYAKACSDLAGKILGGGAK